MILDPSTILNVAEKKKRSDVLSEYLKRGNHTTYNEDTALDLTVNDTE